MNESPVTMRDVMGIIALIFSGVLIVLNIIRIINEQNRQKQRSQRGGSSRRRPVEG